MKRAAAVVLSLVLLVAVAVGADRATAAVLARVVSDRVAQSVPGTGSVSTTVHGVPVLTQLARGSLDHVTVTLTDVHPASGPVLDSVVAELYDVTTGTPRVAGRVDAHAEVSTAALESLLGGGWRVASEEGTLVVTSSGGLPVEARVTPTVRDGRVVLDLASLTVLGVRVDASSLPAAVKAGIESLAGSLGTLPLGLTPTSVTVTSTGVTLTASGTDVALDGA